MASLRSVALLAQPLILAAALALLGPSTSAQNCPALFHSSLATISGIGRTVEVEADVKEKTPKQEVIYTLSWDTDCVDPPQITDDNFNKYFNVDDTTNCTWVVSVRNSLIGVPDYLGFQETTIQTAVDFTGFDNITGSCQVTLKHNIMDENTQKPDPDQVEYTLQIKEDFSSGYTIGGFKTPVHDKDGTSPNNQFSVAVDDKCPLEATQQTYTSGQNAVALEYKLKQKLDFENESSITCSVTFQDKGDPAFLTSATIYIEVEDTNDEPPVFGSGLYYAEVGSVVASDDPLTIRPSNILATDGDTGINDTITYTLHNADETVDGSAYFTIDPNTGAVTLTKDLDNDFLLNERVLFFVTADEDSGEHTQTILEVSLPWRYMVCGGLHFEQAEYVATIFDENEVEVLRVVAVSNNNTYVEYSLNETWGNETLYFNIDPSTGWIYVNEDNPPSEGSHKLQAVATATGVSIEPATTRVTINVKPVSSDIVTILNSFIRVSVEEGEEDKDLGSVDLSSPAQSVCVIAAIPTNMRERFTLEKDSSAERFTLEKDSSAERFTLEKETSQRWTLKKVGDLNYEETQEITLAIQAYEEVVECSQIEAEMPTSLLRSQTQAIVIVNDTNDEPPAFSSENLVVAYPTNEGLRRVVGPVASVQAEDKDTKDLTYSLGGEDSAQFKVDETTGDVYAVDNLNCDQECVFLVKASDGINEDTVNGKVLSLNMEHIFTLLMTNVAVSEVDEELSRLSGEVGAQISKLYVSPKASTTRLGGRTRHRRETTTSLEVHVYSIKDDALMTRDALNSALSGASSTLQADEFVDANVFTDTGSSNDTTGLTVAVAVLGSLLALVLIAGVVFSVYQKRKSKSTTKSPMPINTIGNAYQNESYLHDQDGYTKKSSGSMGHKSNGSLNGLTSAQVHRQPDQESPPLHRSPLSPPSDSIPLRSQNSQQQGGLRRTDPGTPGYYGSSTPAPPPYSSSTTAATSSGPALSTSSSSSSSYPIYAEIKKPKDPKPRPEKDAPLTVFPGNSVDKKDPTDTKFSALKGSPPPRRSNRQEDEDENEGVAYPGGRKTRFDDESSDEEKKSVAFKVMVDTKEIEAENMGPTQKKAEAEKLMEENRKKLKEEGDDDEGDEDGMPSAKL